MSITHQQAREALQEYRHTLAAFHEEPSQENYAPMNDAERTLRLYIKQNETLVNQLLDAQAIASDTSCFKDKGLKLK